jgi:urease accessory protein UreH
MWAAGPQWSDAQVDSLRNSLPVDDSTAVTRIAPRLLVARVLAYSTPAARSALTMVWQLLRPLVFNGRCAQTPRIWAT